MIGTSHTPAQLAAALGFEQGDPEWQTTSNPPVPMERWGKDHWSTFAYVETRIVDHKGKLNADHMRTHANRHPMLLAAKRVGRMFGGGDAYPTRLKRALPLGQVTGDPQPVELPHHDDYDCLDDAIAAGLLTVHMPKVAESGRYAGRLLDANGKVIPAREEFDPGFITGMEEQRLMAYAVFRLTPYGARVAAALREAIGAKVPASSFVPPAREE
jgi:hypothetical protein